MGPLATILAATRSVLPILFILAVIRVAPSAFRSIMACLTV